MPCYTPLKAYKAPGGGVVFDSKQGFGDRPLELACGQCQGCRLKRVRDWTTRIVHESKLHARSNFITLTYDEEHLPSDVSLDVSHWQKFAKRVRKAIGPFRFFHCGEYGERNLRPHYHACVFGLDFSRDAELIREGPVPLWTSPTLAERWGMGMVSFGQVTRQSAAYCASYVMKKARGELAEERYTRVDRETGECWQVAPEYTTMSRRPGLGAGFFEKYKEEMYPADEVVLEGKKFKPPRFYDERLGEQELMDIRRKRLASLNKEDATVERLRVRERAAELRLKRLSKDL